MSTQNLQPITLYGIHGPNPPKIAMVLEELSLPYTVSDVAFSAVKQEPYTTINPNGRLPSIHDPNTSLTLWESGAIIEYLIEKYDSSDHKLSFPAGSNEAYLTKQWLYFQATGQGPYYGQAIWFMRYHPEKVQSALDRYLGEIKRVTGVVEGWLKGQAEKGEGGEDGPWLVGGKYSYADLAWVSWQRSVNGILSKEQFDQTEFPHVQAWMDKMLNREAVKKALARADQK